MKYIYFLFHLFISIIYPGAWQWSKNTAQNNANIPFTGAPGLTVRMPATATIIDYYNLFIQRTTMNMIVTETNRFGATKQ